MVNARPPRHVVRSMPRSLRPLLAVGLLIFPLLPSSAQQTPDGFFESPFDGGWVGTVSAGKESVPFQLNLNAGDKEGVGFVFLAVDPVEGEMAIEVFAAAFGKLSGKQMVLSIDDEAPLLPGWQPPRGRFGTTTLKLIYKAASDTLTGKATGSQAGKIQAVRMHPDLPLQRLWQATIKSGGTETFVQLALTEDDEGGIGGTAKFGSESATVSGQRAGTAVTFDFVLAGEAIEFDGKLKTKNNKLQGNFRSPETSFKATLVPTDGNGKPMKLRAVQRLAAVEVPAGEQSSVRVVGTNFAPGAVVHVDNSNVQLDAVEFVSAKQFDVLITPAETVEGGTELAVRLVNADGETAQKAGAITIDGGNGEPPISFATQIQPIFTNSCATAGCHAGPSGEEGLVLDPGAAFANIVNSPSSQQPGLLRVAPGDPDASYLLRKIVGGPGITGGRMPLNRPALPQSEIDLLRAWIAQGAPNNRIR